MLYQEGMLKLNHDMCFITVYSFSNVIKHPTSR